MQSPNSNEIQIASEIKIIDFHIYRQDSSFENWKKIPASAKINLIKNHIITLCEEYKITSPNALWIIAIKEYSILKTILAQFQTK